jgi:hypothetical protein
MATYSRYEETHKKVIFTVPAPAPLAEIQKAISVAMAEVAEKKGEKAISFDDALMFEPHDDAIHIYYTDKEIRRK